jgi:hypothetical protein
MVDGLLVTIGGMIDEIAYPCRPLLDLYCTMLCPNRHTLRSSIECKGVYISIEK